VLFDVTCQIPGDAENIQLLEYLIGDRIANKELLEKNLARSQWRTKYEEGNVTGFDIG